MGQQTKGKREGGEFYNKRNYNVCVRERGGMDLCAGGHTISPLKLFDTLIPINLKWAHCDNSSGKGECLKGDEAFPPCSRGTHSLTHLLLFILGKEFVDLLNLLLNHFLINQVHLEAGFWGLG